MSIHLRNVYLDIPIYGVNDKSFKNKILTGAGISKFSHNINKNALSVRALSDISLTLTSGERLGIHGDNGSGKTTLLRVMARIYTPTSGQADIYGRISSLMSLTLGLDPEESARVNIISRLRYLGIDTKKISYYIEDIVDFCELGDFLYLPMRTYSSGMFMKVAFALATSVDADIILMDEWLSAGDASFAVKSENRIRNYLSKTPIVVMASHNRTLLDSISTKQVCLQNGFMVS
jgi:lipopolysaccharide transport system ATP-binding protein